MTEADRTADLPHFPKYRRIWWKGGPHLTRPFWRPGQVLRWEWTCSCGTSAQARWKRQVKEAEKYHLEHVS